MFANFESAFFKKNNTEKNIPKEIIKSLSEELPKGFEYTKVHSDMVAIAPESSQTITLQDLNIALPNNLPNDFKPSTMQELNEFIYRAQQKLRINPDENNNIIMNGSKFNMDELVSFPLDDTKVKDTEMYLVPQPFRSPFKITLENNEVKKELYIQRQPYPDMHISRFKSVDNHGFEISYIIDELKDKIQFNFKLNIEDARCVEEIVETLTLYHSCVNGTLKIIGTKLPEIDVSESEVESIDETLKFWKKTLKLEKLLEKRFIPQSQLNVEDVHLIEELYRSLVEKKPFKEYVNINELTLNGYEGMDITELLEAKGLSFKYKENIDVEVFDVKLQLYSVVSLFDFKVSDINFVNKDKSKYILAINPLSGRDIYRSSIHFINEVDADDYLASHCNDSELQNAELIDLNLT